MAKKKHDRQAHFLKEWREFRKMTQEDLAAALKPPTKASVISLLEGYNRKLSDKWLTKLAPALRTTRGAILDHNPEDVDSDILEIWAAIPAADRPRAMQVLRAFMKLAA